MRYSYVPRAVVVHVLFLVVCYLLIGILRWLIPSYSADYLLYSDSLTVDQLNDIRLGHADEIINDTLLQMIPKRKDVEIRIVAADRRRGYFTQVVGYLLEAYHPRIPYMSVCNVEGKMFPELERFQGKMTIHHLSGGDMDRSLLNLAIKKETKNYWECLGLETTARYVLLLEDDALVIPEFPQLMDSLIQQLDQRPNIDYVKFYHPNYLRKIPSIPMTVSAAISLTCLFHGLFYGRLHPLFLPTAIFLYVIIRSFSVQFIADCVFFFTGKAYLSIPESCCTPAVIFRSFIKDAMVTELSQLDSYVGRAKDHILDESRFVGRQTDMNWIIHIGAFSSVRNKEVKLAEKYSAWQQNDTTKDGSSISFEKETRNKISNNLNLNKSKNNCVSLRAHRKGMIRLIIQ